MNKGAKKTKRIGIVLEYSVLYHLKVLEKTHFSPANRYDLPPKRVTGHLLARADVFGLRRRGENQ